MIYLSTTITIVIVALIFASFTGKEESKDSSSACYCPRCDVELRQSQKKTPKYSPCYNCGGDNRVNCAQEEWQECSSCNGTGCKNGYTTNGGKNCAYGHCSYCSGNGGKKKKVMREVCECTSFSCQKVTIDGRFMGYGSIVYDYYYVYECPKCGTEYSGC